MPVPAGAGLNPDDNSYVRQHGAVKSANNIYTKGRCTYCPTAYTPEVISEARESIKQS
jgi:hypothetical protein